jgi:SAM-dependent methyltransferase
VASYSNVVETGHQQMLNPLACPVCGNHALPLDVVDFNKSCEEARGKFLPLSGIPVYYYLCSNCGFCFAPEFSDWTLDEFSKKIYNDQYIDVDPDYISVRPQGNANNLIKTFKGKEQPIRHLDYGGGNGMLSDLLKQAGWQSSCYDPFVNTDVDIATLGKFNLITAFEVFEHVPDVNDLMSRLNSLLDNDGIVMFSTLISDGQIKPNQRISWWYASPRNGHISLFSQNSLATLAKKYNFNVGSFSPGMHMLFRDNIPEWAKHLFQNGA